MNAISAEISAPRVPIMARSGQSIPGAAEEDAPDQATDEVVNTSFEFQHKVFQAPGAVFRKDRASGQVSLHLSLGGIMASLTVQQVVKTFSIAPDSPDGRMLDLVEKGLGFVREIRPGDSLPNELIDGTASWTVEARHYERARSKVLIQLVKWMTDGNSSIEAGVDVLALIETPEIKSKIAEAFGSAARHLGVAEGDKAAVPGMIAELAGELAQIEALREKSAGYFSILKKLKEIAQLQRGDTRVTDTIDRITTMLAKPLAGLRRQLQMVDAQTAEIMSSLRQLAATVQFLRGVRDELHGFVLLWEDLDLAWRDARVERDGGLDTLLTRTYRFAATHYLQTQSWSGPGGGSAHPPSAHQA